MTTHHLTTEEYQAMTKRPNKYGAKRCKEDGFSFDSMVERDFYLWLREDPVVNHIDVHPVFSLPGGIRFTADFIGWYTKDALPQCEVIDVKGMRPKTDFIRMWKLFNATHPLGPLVVVSRKNGKWREMTDPDEVRGW